MAHVIINVIGIVSGVVGIWGFAESRLPPKAQPKSPSDPNKYITTVRVVAGLDGTNGMSHAGGHLSAIMNFDANGNQVSGHSVSERIEDGVHLDFKLASREGAQPITTQIRGDVDNVCIALMSTTWPDDSKFGWTGDWANICGLPSYYSGIIMENGKSPACMWIDGRYNNKHQAPYAIQVTWHDFLSTSGKIPSESEVKMLCGTSFKAYNYALEELPIPTNRLVSTSSGSNKKRDPSTHMGRSDDRLVVSSLSDQNATALCEMPHSYGPDFVSLEEGIYCNMETRETLLLCSSDITGDCFDVESTSHVIRDGEHKPRIHARNPTNIIYW
ncbi:hypothetical protein BS50DRAFT_682731 [Corynespora cassiicola Philippines]|uniref:Uncharacterized protein n=1 Tax=Corynespora cassiicola Philippines TaxID=1448308 RepID=A0A2T2MZY7_CORCC|nr:hypothetical protein BS50DRAFT_682731 [Corynespora cassiicola Philippines]